MPTNSILYPKLSGLISGNSLPKSLSFVQEGLNNLLSDLYYKDLLFNKNPRGDAVFVLVFTASAFLPARVYKLRPIVLALACTVP